jgi:RNA polymerase sigma-54 factor
MEIKQQLKLSQQLVMTPQLQQAIKLLQMSRMELTELVHEELLENPVLEDSMDGRDSREVTPSTEAVHHSHDEGGGPTGGPEDSMRTNTEAVDSKREEIDWERYLEAHALQPSMPGFRGRMGDDEMPGFEQTLTRAEDLVDHLAWQLRMGDFVEDEQRFGALVIGNLDTRGYLSMDGVPTRRGGPALGRRRPGCTPRTPKRSSA